jgi:predicted lipoprotein with Yx(FWY)xxD motif
MVATNPTLGAILVDAAGMTLYTFGPDKPDESACNDGCADFWPALTVPTGTTPTAGPGVPLPLGTFTRTDGTTQVTLGTMPLYTFVADKAPGDVAGQGLNAQGGYWFVVPTDVDATAPDFTKFGFATVAATQVITPGAAVTLTSGAYTIDIPDGAFDTPVTFNLLTGDPTSFNIPSGETGEFAFAFKVQNVRMPSEMFGKFYKPLRLTITSPNIVSGSKYYNVATDGTLTENSTGLQVSAGSLSHPIGGAPVGWVVTSP